MNSTRKALYSAFQKENNSLDLPNYEPLRDELSKILENQRISKKKQDQILETT